MGWLLDETIGRPGLPGLCIFLRRRLLLLECCAEIILIPFSGPSCYTLRCNRRFTVPKCKTNRFRNSFIIRSCIDNLYIYIITKIVRAL